MRFRKEHKWISFRWGEPFWEEGRAIAEHEDGTRSIVQPPLWYGLYIGGFQIGYWRRPKLLLKPITGNADPDATQVYIPKRK